MYDARTKTARVPVRGELAWPVEFVLRHHQKHIYLCRKLPDLKVISTALSDWENKIRWNFALQHVENNSWWQLQGRRKSTAPCSHALDPHWEAYIRETKDTVFQSCARARSRLLHKRANVSNMDGIARWGFQILKKGPWGVLPSDKDGGFVLVLKSEILQAKFDLMNKPQYKPTTWFHDSEIQIIEEYVEAAQMIGDATKDPSLTRALVYKLRRGGRSLCSKLQATVKTHKPAGSVGLRAIHSSVEHFMGPGMRWVAKILGDTLRCLPHVLRDTDHLLQSLSSVVVPADAILLKFDIKEFFMSGKHKQLIEESSKNVPQEIRDGFYFMLQCIIKNQVVEVEDHHWHVLIGSGMGLICSGEVSDISFYELAEKRYAVAPAVQTRNHIHWYGRFKDDGLIIISGDFRSRKAFLNEFQRLAKPFEISIECMSRDSVDMLDVTLYKGARWRATGILDYKPYVKESSQWVPLSPESAHPPHVHTSWPVAQVRRLERRCSNRIQARESVSNFTCKLSACTGQGLFLNDPRPPKQRTQCYRLVIPFAWEWHLARVPSLVRRLYSQWRARLPAARETKVSWRLGGTHLVHVLRKLNGHIHSDENQISAIVEVGRGW